MPTLVLHGDDDQIVPIAAAGSVSRPRLSRARSLKVYAGAPHGMCSTLKDRVNEELLAFFKGAATTASA